jgi:hypothetical protein
LRDAQLRGRLGEIQRFSHRHEISKVPEFHPGPLCQKGMVAQASWYWADRGRCVILDPRGHWDRANQQPMEKVII